jgi:glucose-6-phosphate isomerase
MVVLPYKDRLELFSKYLQQLIMESLGKALNRDGNAVHQGITVLGNKGATDQHSYIQQLRDGLNDFLRDVHPGWAGIGIGVNVNGGAGYHFRRLFTWFFPRNPASFV